MASFVMSRLHQLMRVPSHLCLSWAWWFLVVGFCCCCSRLLDFSGEIHTSLAILKCDPASEYFHSVVQPLLLPGSKTFLWDFGAHEPRVLRIASLRVCFPWLDGCAGGSTTAGWAHPQAQEWGLVGDVNFHLVTVEFQCLDCKLLLALCN